MPTANPPPVVTLAFQLEASHAIAEHLATEIYAKLRDDGVGVPFRECRSGRWILTPEPD